MKDKFYKTALIFSCAAVVICLVQIGSLKDELQNLRNRIDNQTERLSDNINDIYNNVDRMMEQRASLLVADSGEIISGDMETLTAQLLYSVTPKEYSRSSTQAVLTVNGSEYPMTLSDGSYSAEITVPLMEETRVESVSFMENGTTRTEMINWNTTPRYEYLTTVYADMTWSGRGSGKDGVYIWDIESDLHITAEHKGRPAEIVSVELVQVTDGVETMRRKLEENYDDEVLQSINEEYEKEVDMYVDGWTSRAFRCTLDQNFEAPFGSEVRLFAEVVDGDGLRHKCLLHGWTVEDNGRLGDDKLEWWHGSEAVEIYEAENNLIFSLDIDEELYK